MSTEQSAFSPGTLSPLSLSAGGMPGCYWHIADTDTNTYFLSGTLPFFTHTNLSLSPESREMDYRLHGTATVEFPKIKIGGHQGRK